MAEQSYPFDAAGAAGTGGGAAVLEGEWQRMTRAWLASGVIAGTADSANRLAVSANGAAMAVTLATGIGWVEGFLYRNDAAANLVIGAADATNPRIDTVVLRLDRAANNTRAFIKQGVAAANPVAPALTQTDVLWELPLADVRVDAAVGVIAAAKVTDRRVFAGPPGSSVIRGTVVTDNALTVQLAVGQTAAALVLQNSGGATLSYFDRDGYGHIGPLGDLGSALGVSTFADGKPNLRVRAGSSAQTAGLIEAYARTPGSPVFSLTPAADLAVDRRFTEAAGASALPVVTLTRKDADTGPFLQLQSATGGIMLSISPAGTLQLGAGGNGMSVFGNGANILSLEGRPNPEAVTVLLGRGSNLAPRLVSNDVNKTLTLTNTGGTGTTVGLRGSSNSTSGLTVNTNSGVNTVAQDLSTASGDNVNATAVVRMSGPGISHGDFSWVPGATEGFRLTQTGSVFSLTAWTSLGVGTLYYNALTARSSADVKRDVQTLDVTAGPRTKLQQLAASNPARARGAGVPAQRTEPVAQRLRELRPVTYRYKNDDPTRSPVRHGFVAEEIAAALPEVAVYDSGTASLGADGKPLPTPAGQGPTGAVYGYDLSALVTLTVATLQDVMARLERLEAAAPARP